MTFDNIFYPFWVEFDSSVEPLQQSRFGVTPINATSRSPAKAGRPRGN